MHMKTPGVARGPHIAPKKNRLILGASGPPYLPTPTPGREETKGPRGRDPHSTNVWGLLPIPFQKHSPWGSSIFK